MVDIWVTCSVRSAVLIRERMPSATLAGPSYSSYLPSCSDLTHTGYVGKYYGHDTVNVVLFLAKLSVLAKRPTIPDGFSKAELPIVVNVLYKKSRITNAQNSRKNKCP